MKQTKKQREAKNERNTLKQSLIHYPWNIKLLGGKDKQFEGFILKVKDLIKFL